MDMRRRSWHKLDIAEAAAALSVDPSRGLDEEEIERRRELAGSNTLPESSHRSSLRAFLEQFQSPLIYILFIAALFAFALDRYGDSIVILVVVFINAVLGWFQERRAERSMEALRQLSVLRTMVVRDGTEKDLEVSELVPGDIILLAAGDGVGADARLLEVTVLEAAEAALTGESMPVAKHTRALPQETLLADRVNMIYSGTHITSGRCRALVVSTGQETEVGYEPTGSLTQGEVELAAETDDGLRPLIRAGALCNNAHIIPPDQENKRWRSLGDPTEAALLTLASKACVESPQTLRAWMRLAELPFNPDEGMMATAHVDPESGHHIIIKGAPESIIERCSLVLWAEEVRKLFARRRLRRKEQ